MLKISFWRLQRTDLTFVANQLSMCSESTLTCSESTLTCSESTCSDLQRNGFVAKRQDTFPHLERRIYTYILSVAASALLL